MIVSTSHYKYTHKYVRVYIHIRIYIIILYRKFIIEDFTYKVLCICVGKIFVQHPYDSFLNIIKCHFFADTVLECEP